MNKLAEKESVARRFGTFGGVFVPNVLTILGIILFMRTGWVVGNAGLTNAIIIIVIANLITLATGFSLSAICTNTEAKTGGVYYLISRSLGGAIGGSIGVPLFLSQAVSVAFYLIGFSEVLAVLIPQIDPRITATTVCIGFAVIAYRGASFAIKIQYVILGILVLSLISFFLGNSSVHVDPGYAQNYLPGQNFWSVFAIFFPAATGIMAGASMSGDLKNPGRSIPLGTILAILVTAVIYILVAYYLAHRATPNELIVNNIIMHSVSRWPVLIFAGVFAATLSSALATMLAAPRTLQALAIDQIVPRIFAKQMGSETEPRLGIIVTFIIAETVILMGNLNLVAPIITMFFLNTYGMTNLAAGLEKLVGSPSYRPKFKVHWSISLLGAFGCYCAMFLIHTPATIVAIIISYGIFFLLERRSMNQSWGDVRSGAWFSLVRFALLKLEDYKWHPRNWKPNMLVFSGNPRERGYLADLVRWLSKGKGINTLVQLIVGKPKDMGGKEGMKALGLKNLRRFISESKMETFAKCEVVSEFEEGVLVTSQAHGVGGVRPNVVLFGWSDKLETQTMLVRIMRKLYILNKSVFILKIGDEENAFRNKKTIDVWWARGGGNGDMMLLLAHLISLHHDWKSPRIRMLTLIDDPEGKEQAKKNIDNLLKKARLKKEPVILTKERPDQPVSEVVYENSKDTDLTILGLGIPEEGEEEEYAERLNSFVKSLGSVLMVRSVETEELL
jgi:amino acid transporter